MVLNSNVLNNSLLWGRQWQENVVYDDFTFDWYGLQNKYITISKSNHNNQPNISLSTSLNSQTNWGVVLNKQYTTKNITLIGSVSAETIELFWKKLDELKQRVSKTEWFLDIKHNWIIRRCKATVVNSNIFDINHYNITFCPLVLEFKTLEPFSYEKTEWSHAYNSISSDLYEEITYNWTIETDVKTYFVFWNSISWLTELSLLIWDEKIIIQETISDDDVLIIDWEKKAVTLNWIEIEYNWIFPKLYSWFNTIEYKFNWTFSCDITVLYKNKYL